jgi:hypothetical protein
MTTILAQMGRDAVGTSQNGQVRSPDRIRMGAAAGIPHGRDMIYVDAEA